MSAEAKDLSYPRPQLRRKQWMCLDGPWRFALDNSLSFRAPKDLSSWPLRIEVPFAPESARSGIGNSDFHQACWYEREFDLPHVRNDERVILHFGAVDYFARVWV